MNKTTTCVFVLILAVSVAACETRTQYSSGAEYLSSMRAVPTAEDTTGSRAVESNDAIDRAVSNAAAVEPNLVFPARLGLARIYRGRLTAIPRDEGTAWRTLAEKLGADYGEFVPISPLVAEMASSAAGASIASMKHDRLRVIDKIRIGAARQHVDAVLVYETTGTVDDQDNFLSIANWTIIGAAILPSSEVKVRAVAQAMFIDVRNGYPYGTAQSIIEDETLTTAFDTRDQKKRLYRKASVAVVAQLADDVADMMNDLYIKSLKARVARNANGR